MSNFANFVRQYVVAFEQLPSSPPSGEFFVARLKSCRQVTILGLGASHILAEKFAHQLRSCGKLATAMSVDQMLHGDLGLMQDGSLVVFLSRSGNISAASEIIKYAKLKKCDWLTLSESPALSEHLGTWVSLGPSKESDHFGLLPSVSFSRMAVYLDWIVASIIRDNRKFPTDFSDRHPMGNLGATLSSPVDIFVRGPRVVLTLSSDNENLDLTTIELLIGQSQRGTLPIVDDDNILLGVVTDGDLRRNRHKFSSLENLTRGDVNLIGTTSPRIVHAGQSTASAIEQMLTPFEVSSLIVVSEGSKFFGVVHARDVLMSLATP